MSLVGGFERERPGLPAIALATDASQGGLAGAVSADQLFAQQVRVLGQTGDVLLVLDPAGASRVLAAIDEAHEREMTVVALTGGDGQRSPPRCPIPIFRSACPPFARRASTKSIC